MKGVRRISAADVAFAVAAVLTAAYYHRLARRHFFTYDDWGAAARPGALTDLFEPFNSHLSVVPLAVYRSLFRVFGLEHFAPFRPLGITFIVALATGIYIYVRQRLGAWPALIVAMAVLWVHSLQLTPFLFNFHLALLLGVVCAAALPSRTTGADATLAVALAAALCTSAVGVAVAAACAVHSLLSGFRLRRWLAVGVPVAGWVLWWATLGVHDRTGTGSFLDGVRSVSDGSFGSFEALAAGTFFGGLALAVFSTGLLVWRAAHDRDAARMQLAWLAALVVWWIGLVMSRPEASASAGNTPRYEYVGAVFVLLSLIPPHPVELVRANARHPAMVAIATCAAVAIVAANQPSIRALSRDRQTTATWVGNILVEIGQGPQVVPDAQRLPQLLYHLTAGEYRELVERRGSPFAVPEDPDAYLIRRGAVLVEWNAPSTDGGVCLDDPATLEVGSELQLQTGDRPVKVSARRFGPEPVPVRLVPAGTRVRLRTWGPSVASAPWQIAAPGGCLVPIAPP